MNITITARHCAITDTVRDRTEQRVRQLGRFNAGIRSVEVVYDEVAGSRHAELVVHVTRRTPLVVQGSGDTFRSALDAALGRVVRRVKRDRERRRRRRAAPAVDAGLPPLSAS